MSSEPRRPDRTLQLSPGQMRDFGNRVVEMLVEHFTTLPEKPVTRIGGRRILEGKLREPPPEKGVPPSEALERLRRDVFSSMMHVDHPRFFAFVPSPGNFVGAMADALASGFNSFVGTWLAGSGAAQIELITIDWLKALCGLPEEAGGVFVSGGSMANLTALAVARRRALNDDIAGAVVYCSDQTHSSVERGLRVLGFASGQIRKLPSDDGFRLSPPRLSEAVSADRASGRRPFCVIANAGTTNTGAVDPLPELAAFCRCERLWLHADGAYGAAAALCEKGKLLLEGLGEVDSLVLDPHKWLFQPFEIGCALVRDAAWLPETFSIMPEYLQDADRSAEEVNLCNRGIQLSRGFRALKLWLSLQVFGLESVREAVAWGFTLAEKAEARLRASGRWEIVAPATMGIVSFRRAPTGAPAGEEDARNADLVAKMIADGYAMLSSTVLRGRTVLRLCTINPRTTEEELNETIRRLEGF